MHGCSQGMDQHCCDTTFLLSNCHVADVSAHVVGPGKTKFGAVAAELWSRHMQWAEGPKAFERGYRYLCGLFARDGPRLEYLRELYNSPERHNFGAVHTYVFHHVSSNVSPHASHVAHEGVRLKHVMSRLRLPPLYFRVDSG